MRNVVSLSKHPQGFPQGCTIPRAQCQALPGVLQPQLGHVWVTIRQLPPLYQLALIAWKEVEAARWQL